MAEDLEKKASKPSFTASESPGYLRKMSNIGVILDKIAEGTSSPTAMIMDLFLNSVRGKRAKFHYEVVRKDILCTPIKAPDGFSYKLPGLQRKYLRYYVVEYLNRNGETWEQSYVTAAEILKLPSGKTLAPTTMRDCHAYVKKMILTSPEMKAFCSGLEHDFPIAMAKDGKPERHTYFDPAIHLEADHS